MRLSRARFAAAAAVVSAVAVAVASATSLVDEDAAAAAVDAAVVVVGGGETDPVEEAAAAVEEAAAAVEEEAVDAVDEEAAAAAVEEEAKKFEFERFRPNYHFLPETNWMNTPAGSYYDPNSDEYHVFFQYNPHGSGRDKMTWGHAVSEDMITWTDMPLAIEGSEDLEDREGVFSGHVVASGHDHLPTAYYTAASGHPTWKEKYTRGVEKIMMATSSDDGRTWDKHPDVLIDGPPMELSVYGWRDPYLFTSPEIDRLFDVPDDAPPTQYMVISSSERRKGGRVLLYASNDGLEWEYKGPLFSPKREKPTSADDFSGKAWIASFGLNFEAANFFTLSDESGEAHSFIVVGSEGGRRNDRDDQWNLWVSGDLVKDGAGRVTLRQTARGIADAGVSYGGKSFWDSKNERLVAYYWLKEDIDCTHSEWAGALSLPREHFVATYKNVIDPGSRLDRLGPFMVSRGPRIGGVKTKIVKTLGVRPIREVEDLRRTEVYSYEPARSEGRKKVVETLPISGKFYEIVATAKRLQEEGRVGFIIRHNADMSEQTRVYFDQRRGRIVIDRSRSTREKTANKAEDSGKFDLFQVACESEKCVTREALHLRIFVDNSVLEVYANDRFVLSSRIYPSEDALLLSSYSTKGAAFDEVTVYDKFESVFPGRGESDSDVSDESENDVADQPEESAATPSESADAVAETAAAGAAADGRTEVAAVDRPGESGNRPEAAVAASSSAVSLVTPQRIGVLFALLAAAGTSISVS